MSQPINHRTDRRGEMTTSYNTEEHIKNLIEELEGIVYELRDCLTLIEFANNTEKIDDIRQRAKEARDRAKRWM